MRPFPMVQDYAMGYYGEIAQSDPDIYDRRQGRRTHHGAAGQYT